MMKVLLVGCFLLALPTRYDGGVQAQPQEKPQLTVKLADDFQVTGAGRNQEECDQAETEGDAAGHIGREYPIFGRIR